MAKTATVEEIEVDEAADSDLSVRKMARPVSAGHAEMIEGEPEDIASQIIELIKGARVAVMSNDVLVISEHFSGQVGDISYEMVGKAKELAGALGGKAIAVLLGSDAADLAGTFASDATIYVDDPALAEFNPEAYGVVLEALLADRSPRLTMIGSTTMGMDLAAWLAARSGHAFVAYVSDLAVEGGDVVATSQLYAGKMMAEVSPYGRANGCRRAGRRLPGRGRAGRDGRRKDRLAGVVGGSQDKFRQAEPARSGRH